MRMTGPINVLFAAMVSAAIHGGVALIAVPVVSFFILASANGPGDAATERGMILAVVAPICCAAIGFVLGAIMASVANVVAAPARAPVVVRGDEPAQAYSASAAA